MFVGIERKEAKKPDLTYLFKESKDYGNWTSQYESLGKERIELLEEFIEEYDKYEERGDGRD